MTQQATLLLSACRVPLLVFAAAVVTLALSIHRDGPFRAAPAAAANFSPVTVQDLVDAINAANINGVDDVIDLGGNTFTLTAVDNGTDGNNGLPSVTEAATTLTIQNGTLERDAAALTDFRILHVSATGTLVLDDVTVTNGASFAGGGIWNAGTLTLNNGSSVTGNTRGSTPDVDGIGIYNLGTLTLDGGSSVSGNTTAGIANMAMGGGIYNSGLVTLDGGSSVSDNTVVGQFGFGGGIFNADAGTLTIRGGSSVSGNTAVNVGGGGIYNVGSVLITDSTISGNTANFGSGGGILSPGNGSVTLVRSTVGPGNTATVNGGGIYNGATLDLINSTVSGNTAGASGGGVHNINVPDNTSVTTLTNVTVTNNSATAGAGGGLVDATPLPAGAPDNTIHLTNTIVSGNPNGGDCVSFDGTFISHGNNLDGDNSCFLSAAMNDIPGGNAGLGPLADNGGLTQTHALMTGSDAIDAGNDAVCEGADPPVDAIDQRGVIRPQDGDEDGAAQCDIGAFELEPPVAALTVVKLCPFGEGDAAFVLNVTDEAGASVGFGPIACGDTMSLPGLAAGDYTLTETLAGPDAPNFDTGIACTEGLPPVEGTTATVTLASSGIVCVLINAFDDPADTVAPPLLPLLLFIDLTLDNQNHNVVEIDNTNANTNANENANENSNTNENDNVQDQANDQAQDNTNEQTNNITSSPSVNIDWD